MLPDSTRHGSDEWGKLGQVTFGFFFFRALTTPFLFI